MYAMTGKLAAQPDMREKLSAILVRASGIVAQLPGCRAYIVSEDVTDDACIWVFEIWDDKESHDASLQNKEVRALIAEAMPCINGAPSGTELRVVGGHGI